MNKLLHFTGEVPVGVCGLDVDKLGPTSPWCCEVDALISKISVNDQAQAPWCKTMYAPPRFLFVAIIGFLPSVSCYSVFLSSLWPKTEATCPSLSARLQGFSDLGERPGSLYELPTRESVTLLSNCYGAVKLFRSSHFWDCFLIDKCLLYLRRLGQDMVVLSGNEDTTDLMEK